MSNNPNSVVWGGGGKKPLTNPLKTPKNSTPQKLNKKSKKIQKTQKEPKNISKNVITYVAKVLFYKN